MSSAYKLGYWAKDPCFREESNLGHPVFVFNIMFCIGSQIEIMTRCRHTSQQELSCCQDSTMMFVVNTSVLYGLHHFKFQFRAKLLNLYNFAHYYLINHQCEPGQMYTYISTLLKQFPRDLKPPGVSILSLTGVCNGYHSFMLNMHI